MNNIRLISAVKANIKRGGTTVLHNLEWLIEKGQHWAVTGPSGSGKTTLLQALAGQIFTAANFDFRAGLRVVLVPQQHRFTNLSHTQDFYYQQRFNSFDAEDAPTVEAAFPQLFSDEVNFTSVQKIKDIFALEALQQRRLIQLSNGENKKLQLACALLQQPDLLLLDNPFIGLDAPSRSGLELALAALDAYGITVVLTCAPQRIPSFITHVLEIKSSEATQVHPVATFNAINKKEQDHSLINLPEALYQGQQSNTFEYAVKMDHVQVRYGNKQVLQNISWAVLRGERWLLSGANGAGKSTLLSLITADNPQAYANEIYLFDKRRGTGESIWDIKRNLGYVSPELHLYFDAGASVFDTVASGFFDTIGLFRQLSAAQENKVILWLQFLQLLPMKNRLLSLLPLGQQRLALLARALIKNPPLLVLDEPTQGLDETQTTFFNGIVDALCNATDQTLIYVSHYNDELPLCITRHLHLNDGKVVA